MRKKVWTLSPNFIIFSVVMLGMAVVTYYYNPIVSIVELCVAVASIAIVLIWSIRFKRYMTKTISNTTPQFSAQIIVAVVTNKK